MISQYDLDGLLFVICLPLAHVADNGFVPLLVHTKIHKKWYKLHP